MGCAELVDALEQRLRGERAGPQQEALDAHLPGCADCRGYLEVAARVERQLVERAQAPDSAAMARGRERAMASIQGFRQEQQRLSVLSASALIAPVFERLTGGPWLGRDGWERAAMSFGCAGIIFLVVRLARFAQSRLSAPMEVARTDQELVLAYRSQLDLRLLKARNQPWAFAASFAVTGGMLIFALLVRDRFMVGFSLVLAASCAAAWPVASRYRASLERERESLS